MPGEATYLPLISLHCVQEVQRPLPHSQFVERASCSVQTFRRPPGNSQSVGQAARSDARLPLDLAQIHSLPHPNSRSPTSDLGFDRGTASKTRIQNLERLGVQASPSQWHLLLEAEHVAGTPALAAEKLIKQSFGIEHDSVLLRQTSPAGTACDDRGFCDASVYLMPACCSLTVQLLCAFRL